MEKSLNKHGSTKTSVTGTAAVVAYWGKKYMKCNVNQQEVHLNLILHKGSSSPE